MKSVPDVFCAVCCEESPEKHLAKMSPVKVRLALSRIGTSDLDSSYSLTPLNLLFCGVKLISIDGTTIYNLVPDT